MSNLWIHPALILIFGGLLLPLVPARLKKGWLLLVPLLVFLRVFSMAKGVFGVVHFLDWTLTFGRVDSLSAIFGYIMSLACIIGTLYGLHVKEDAQHVAAWFYVAGSLGVIFAGDFLTLFLFWELMAFSSVFLVWFRRRPESLAAGYRSCSFTLPADWRCWPAWCCITRRRAVGTSSRSTCIIRRPPCGWC